MRNAIKYLASFIFVPLGILAVFEGGIWSFGVPFVAFLLIPLVELAWNGNGRNLTQEEEEQYVQNPVFNGMVYSLSLTHIGLVLAYLWQISKGALVGWHLVGATWSMGILCGAYGINIAHELGHRKQKGEQWLAKILLMFSMYMHFFIEHNRGHHAHVATDEDPATARYGETLYAFWMRSIALGYLSAWKLEQQRLERKGKHWFHLTNEMLQFQLLQVAFLAIIGVSLGLQALLAFLCIATIGIFLLETINYIEHYGLQRKRKTNNQRYEQVLPIHSWNSNHPLGRIMLFELTRHSDHHAHASRRYQILRHFDESPQLPTGYPGMMLLALCPPLWFAVMHKHIEQYQTKLTETIASSPA